MIIERNIFHLKFGKAKDAIIIWKQICDVMRSEGKFDDQLRIMTDLTGDSYTLINEFHVKSFTEITPVTHWWQTNQKIRELYAQFVPLCESAKRELYKIEAEWG